MPLEPNVIAGRKVWGFFMLGVVCFLHTLPLLFVSLLANLSSVSPAEVQARDCGLTNLQLTVYVAFLRDWKESGKVGNWYVRSHSKRTI